MDEYIKRSNAVQCARDVANDFKNDGLSAEAGGADTVGDWLQDFPAADVRPVVHGQWIYDCERTMGDGWTYKQRHCSECGYQTVECNNFCSNCGADMRKES